MAPCEIDIRPKGKKDWINVGRINPGDQPGSISDVSKGEREVYLFECAHDDSKSTIYRSRFGVDFDLDSETRVVTPLEDPELVKELGKGDSYEMDITTERDQSGTIRFIHT